MTDPEADALIFRLFAAARAEIEGPLVLPDPAVERVGDGELARRASDEIRARVKDSRLP